MAGRRCWLARPGGRGADGSPGIDLDADPHELNNLYGHAAYAERTDELRAELERLRELYAVDVE